MADPAQFRVASTLVIAAKRDVHRELEALFAGLRAELPKRAIAADSAEPSKSGEMSTVVYRLLHAASPDARDAIVSLIAPQSWRPDGGTVAIVKMRRPDANDNRSWDALIVRQTEDVQDKIRELLGELGRIDNFRGLWGGGP